MINTFLLPDSIGPRDPLKQCWQFHTHSAHAWAQLIGRDLRPYTCLGTGASAIFYPIITEQELAAEMRKAVRDLMSGI